METTTYPPKTLYPLLTWLWRHMKELDDNALNTENPQLKKLHNTIDTIFRKLRVAGVGAERKSAEPFNKDNENELWSSGVMQLQLENEVVQIVGNDEVTDCCHCRLLDQFISKLPVKVKLQDLFYVRPIDKAPSQEWFTSVPISCNSLTKMIPEICKGARIDCHETITTAFKQLEQLSYIVLLCQRSSSRNALDIVQWSAFELTNKRAPNSSRQCRKYCPALHPPLFSSRWEHLNGTPSVPVWEKNPTNFTSPQSSPVTPNLSFSGCINFGQMTLQSPLISHQYSANRVHATQELELPTLDEVTACLQDIESHTI